MYVRREIRSLSAIDLERFMRALRVIYTEDGTTGRLKYGVGYLSSEELLNLFYQMVDLSDDDVNEDSGDDLMQEEERMEEGIRDVRRIIKSLEVERRSVDSVDTIVQRSESAIIKSKNVPVNSELSITQLGLNTNQQRKTDQTLSSTIAPTSSKGLDFLPQRMRLSLMLETSLQSIDRSLSLPYWDYTIEAEGMYLS